MANAHGSKPPRSRFQRTLRTGIVLTERDEVLLVELAHSRLMSRSQIEALYFSSTARANSRLRLLFDHGYVRRKFVPEDSYGAEALYLPGIAAAEVLARRLEIELEEALRLCKSEVAPLFVAHTLTVVDVKLGFLEGARATGASITRWLSEAESFHEFALKSRSGATWEWKSLRPDAYCCLFENGTEGHCFLEVDLGNCSAKAFAEKIARYSEYLTSGIFAETYRAQHFAVLTIATGERRLRTLMALTEKLERPEFLFTTFALVDAHGPFAPIWKRSPNTKRQNPHQGAK